MIGYVTINFELISQMTASLQNHLIKPNNISLILHITGIQRRGFFFSYEKREAEVQLVCVLGKQTFKVFLKFGPITKLLPILTNTSMQY